MKIQIVSSFAALSLLLAGTAQSAVVVGVNGNVKAGAVNLHCGNSILPGTTITTGNASGVGIMSGDIYTQIAPDSVVRYDERDGKPHYDVDQGGLRMIDANNDPAAGASVGAASAEVELEDGSDVEAHALSEKAGVLAVFCDWDKAPTVTRDGQSLGIEPGGCVISNPREALYAAQGNQDPTKLRNTDGCMLPAHFGPGLPDVAAGPPGPAFPGPGLPIDPRREVCDPPASGCSGVGGPMTFEPPPVNPGPGVPGIGGPGTTGGPTTVELPPINLAPGAPGIGGGIGLQ